MEEWQKTTLSNKKKIRCMMLEHTNKIREIFNERIENFIGVFVDTIDNVDVNQDKDKVRSDMDDARIRCNGLINEFLYRHSIPKEK